MAKGETLNERPMTEDERVTANSEAALADQTPVYPVTTMAPRKAPAVQMRPIGDEQYVSYTPAQLGKLLDARAILAETTQHASDGSDDDAAEAIEKLDKLLDRYPTVAPKPKKPK